MNTPQFIPRKSYTIAYKLQVIDYALLHCIFTAAQLFHLHVSMIYRWIPRREEMMMILSDCKSTERKRRMGSPGRRVEYPEEELHLHAWINDQRLLGVPPVYPDIQEKMLTMTAPSCSFKASYGWLYGFLSRMNLSLRQTTKTVVASSTCHADQSSKQISGLACFEKEDFQSTPIRTKQTLGLAFPEMQEKQGNARKSIKFTLLFLKCYSPTAVKITILRVPIQTLIRRGLAPILYRHISRPWPPVWTQWCSGFKGKPLSMYSLLIR